MQSAKNGLEFFSQLQLDPGNWACEYGGPMFLLPGLVVTWYVTETPVPEAHSTEIKNYLYARQNKDGGWGLHIEGDSSVFGTSMNYTAMRLLGASADDPRMIKARQLLHSFGGAVNGPHWAKFWLSILGVCQWDIVNPVPPELWYGEFLYSITPGLTRDKAAPRLGSNCSMAMVDPYAPGLSSNVLPLVQRLVIPSHSSHNGPSSRTFCRAI
jgi:squalene cyclase